MDVSNKSYAELQEMIAALKVELEEKRTAEKKSVIAEIKRLAATVNLRVEIIDDEKPSKQAKATSEKVAPKYRNPDNHVETWSGRGLKPRWLREKIDAGAVLEDFSI